MIAAGSELAASRSRPPDPVLPRRGQLRRCSSRSQYGIESQGTQPLARLPRGHEVMRRFLGREHRFRGRLLPVSPLPRRDLFSGPFHERRAIEGPGSFRTCADAATACTSPARTLPRTLAFAAGTSRSRSVRPLAPTASICPVDARRSSRFQRPRQSRPDPRPPSHLLDVARAGRAPRYRSAPGVRHRS